MHPAPAVWFWTTIGLGGIGVNMLVSVSIWLSDRVRFNRHPPRHSVEKYAYAGSRVGQDSARGGELNDFGLASIRSFLEEDANRLQEGSVNAEPFRRARPEYVYSYSVRDAQN